MANPLKDLSFQALFDAAADAMLLVNDAGHVVEANAAALLLLEYSEEASLGLASRRSFQIDFVVTTTNFVMLFSENLKNALWAMVETFLP